MNRNLVVLCCGLFLLSPVLATGLHREAAECRLAYPGFPEDPSLSGECYAVCIGCHVPTDDPGVPGYPLPPPDVAAEGDAALCGNCHEEEVVQARGSYLLTTHGGNHPTNVSYDEAARRIKLHSDPQGPKLYVAPHTVDRRVHCSTCHDPMGAARHVLRTDNRGSALCLKCHDL